MASESESLQRLRNLYQDLVDLTNSRLPNIERLHAELEARLDEFKTFLDKPSKNDKSRQAIGTDKIEIEGEEYEINNEFRQETILLADYLDLDEIQSAKLYSSGVENASVFDRAPFFAAVVLFHERRQYLLECVRLSLAIVSDEDIEDEGFKDLFRQVHLQLFQSAETQPRSGSTFYRRCLNEMSNNEKWVQSLSDQVQRVTLTGQTPSQEEIELLQYQNDSLKKQHESLGVIGSSLIVSNNTKVEDFQLLLSRLKQLDQYDITLAHYFPLLAQSIFYFGSNEGHATTQEIKDITPKITSTKDDGAWTLRSFQATACCLWYAEYNSRFLDERTDTLGGESNSNARSKALTDALQDGGFHFLLAICRDLSGASWYDPMRQGLLDFLLQDAPVLRAEPFNTERYFVQEVKLLIQNFVEALITNMPDTLRDLKQEEDEQRRQLYGPRFQSQPDGYELHLERFFVIISLAYEGSEDSAERFWTESDGNLYGFLQWASQRQSTPHVAAFCEMLRSLSQADVCADYAHEFLLEGGSGLPGKLRRSNPLSWKIITEELAFYADPSLNRQGRSNIDQLVEPESAMMLECYLRLFSHMLESSPAARSWLIYDSSFLLHRHILKLCGSPIQSRLRGCAFSVLSSLLTNKDRQSGEGMWIELDRWIYHSGDIVSKSTSYQNFRALTAQSMFELFSQGFEESYAFVVLLQRLVNPYGFEGDLKDILPFSENLGSSYRMPGIESYVDFVLGQVFAMKSIELSDLTQLQILRHECLHFAVTCLSSFNDELVIIANRSSINVDSTMRTSSLASYVRLHPFARVMEWFFNDKAVSALFATARQDVREVNEALPDSPLVLGLLQSIRVINLVLQLQPTYFDIVKPIVKGLNNDRRPGVANSALASFEDAILNEIAIVPSICLYTASGHQDLAIASVQLLRNLVSSRRLISPITTGSGRQLEKSRLITALEKNNDLDQVSKSMASLMRVDMRELEQGPSSTGYVIKLELLRFLNGCIETVPNKPNIAHALLGFVCDSRNLDFHSEGLWAHGESLFHVIMRYVTSTPDGDGQNFFSWCIEAKEEAMKLISRLATAQLSSRLVLPELRATDFVVLQWLQSSKITPEATWDGRAQDAPDFMLTSSISALIGLLEQRRALLDCTNLGLRTAINDGLITYRDHTTSLLQGSANLSDGQQGQCPSIIDFGDFFELEIDGDIPLPQSKFFDMSDFEICKQMGSSSHLQNSNISVAEQLLHLKTNELKASSKLTEPASEQQAKADADNILFSLQANNSSRTLLSVKIKVLRSWSALVVVALQLCDFDVLHKTSFVIQILQLIIPRFEQSLSSPDESTVILAQLCRTLALRSSSLISVKDTTPASSTLEDRLLQLFKVSLNGLQDPFSSSSGPLKEILAQICHEYTHTIPLQSNPQKIRQHILQSVKGQGDGLMDSLCDEALSGETSSRTAILLLLGALAGVTNQCGPDGVKYIINSFARINFLPVLISSMGNLALDLREQGNTEQVLTTYNATLFLLIRLCQTRQGASTVINSGFFSSVRYSGLLSADAELGLEVDNPKVLNTYFRLLRSITQIINAAMLSRGPQNKQMLDAVRGFLNEYRSTIVEVLKRSAGVGILAARDVNGRSVNRIGDGDKEDDVLDELVEGLIMMMTYSGFVEAEEESDKKVGTPLRFT